MSAQRVSMTDRYVAAALRGVHANQRDDVAAELRASIADAIDARVEQGEPPVQAERAVLTDLGDPIRLSAEYSGRPLYLIGPGFYPDYIRLLRLLLSIVVPIVAVVVGAATAIDGSSVWQVIPSAIGAAFSVGVQLAFWVTVVFALIERNGVQPRSQASTWDVDDLPDVADRRVGLGDTVASIVGLSLLMWFLLWQPTYQVNADSPSAGIPILNPDLSTFWIPFLVVVLLASIALEVAKYRIGRWTLPLAGINTIVSLAFAVPAIWLLANGQVVNPAFVDAIASAEFTSFATTAPTVIAWIIAAIAVFDITEGWWKTYR